MISVRSLAISIFCALLSAHLSYAQDLSTYREFQFGMDLPAIAILTTEIEFSLSEVYNNRQVAITRWEDSPYSFSLFRSFYLPAFGMIGFSKRLDALAQAATIEAIQMDKQGAPQLEIKRQEKRDEEPRAAQEKARLADKLGFRP